MWKLLERVTTYYHSEGLLRLIGGIWLILGQNVHSACFTLAQLWDDICEREYSLRTIFVSYYRGFKPKTYCWLDIQNNDPNCYAADVGEYAGLNSGYEDVTGNDYAFYRLSKRYTDAIPDLYGTIENGGFVPVDTQENSILDLVRTHRIIVLKPMTGSQGDGFYRIEYNGSGFLINDELRSGQEVQDTIEKLTNYTVTEYITQHDYCSQIYERTPNTIRILTIIDPRTHESVVLRACHRFGSSDSYPTDNWSRSGYAAPVDVDTGRIKEIILLNEIGQRFYSEQHPETGSQVTGITVPYWEKSKDVVRRLADLHRPAPIIGWDVIITEDGPIIIEANTPGDHLIQFEKGLYEDARFRRLMNTQATT
ncbi:sugar-transfer associated ATP-grasp domain-containing protein [Halomontanus rarus]|uniref:sugar-transfer associated ATP-grasp domain-containing protein n=1 Tax=Halomontanus rarus TaxID=3034020 RepID=UPI0023E8BF74|nr:sugar-transfer associated ATP-grasp domain-containing protein [Halovivax sp. TS33]